MGGSPANRASVDYVAAKAAAAGLDVTVQPFEFEYNADASPAVLNQVSPSPTSYVDGTDFASMTSSGSGDITAPVIAVDLVLPQAPAAGLTTSGCEAADFAGFPAGAIALMQRGTCPFGTKADNAAAAGAVGSVIFNDGGDAGRVAVVNGTLGTPVRTFPVVGASLAVGQDLANGIANGSTGSTARLKVDRVVETRTTYNVIAETPGGDPEEVVVVGAHLDSVPRGPGINDNGSGSAAILAMAEALQGRDVHNKVRFAWWNAEEFGLLGSAYYVSQLSQEQKDDIALNLNFDMIGSPNYVRFVYDGDNSGFPVGPGAAAGPDGSGLIEKVFHDYFGAVGIASAETPFSGRSDYGPFIAAGIPAGGLFTGAEGIKTAAQAAVFGGTAGQAYDPCYHLACDTFANNSNAALDEMGDAAAHTLLTFARWDFSKRALTNPAGPVEPRSGSSAGGEGGGLHDHDHEPEVS
ncbi:M28 family peptidase [Nocardioides pinisoli]|uniref:M28 family peptidase n=1 Tax=Nocardioides pinisoli TaxID=2950279 RepID=A0ABT1KYI1_9ACTN|nr:M28 family peptidase [Nocardioides pinisoli]MCP3422820.1 M28 family peptidase [Nocardioides pinisoli]